VVDLATLSPFGAGIRSIRGNEIAMIFQEPMTSLSPVHTIGSQIAEAVQLHQRVNAHQANERAIEMLAQVGIGNPTQRFHEYPHHLSGGMRQRVMIAMALSCNPSLLIADEPTTALDVTIQAQILELMQSLQERFHMAILLITHNLGVIAEMADRVAVMYTGKVVELTDASAIFDEPLHPYTLGLMRSIPRLGVDVKRRLEAIPGSVPDPLTLPTGCTFYPRCPAPKRPACAAEVPLTEVKPGHWARCTLYQ
jgi:peptide/nickel transport system ATP-binding protein/oligopeptide transport system ATP-binding protein